MAVSIKDIAREAGVSHSTVSRALHGSSLIPGATAERIQQIAKRMGYTANAIGRGLVKGRTEAIGVVVTSISDPFNGEVVEGLEEVANQQGYSVILATSRGNADREVAVVREFQFRRVDGIVVASSRVGSNYSKLLAGLQIPVVLLNNQHPNEFGCSVRIDNTQGVFEATNHLLALGHRRIAYIGDRFGLYSDSERLLGFRQAMRNGHAAVPARFITSGEGKLTGVREPMLSLFDDAGKGRLHSPTALICYNDLTAIGAMEVAKEIGISVPRDLSIVGFDDIQVAALVSPALTTVRQPKKQLGMDSMSVLLKLLRDEEVQKSIVLRGELIVRGTTAAPSN